MTLPPLYAAGSGLAKHMPLKQQGRLQNAAGGLVTCTCVCALVQPYAAPQADTRGSRRCISADILLSKHVYRNQRLFHLNA